MKAISILLLVVLCAVGCAKERARAIDPLEDFKGHVSRLQNAHGLFEWTNIEYDVRKTDSLVSPHMALLKARARYKDAGYVDFDATLALQDSRWVLKQCRIRHAHGSDWESATLDNSNKQFYISLSYGLLLHGSDLLLMHAIKGSLKN